MSARHTLAALALLTALAPARAGDDEAGAWVELGLKKTLTRRWSAGLEAEYRAQDKARWAVGAGAEYKPCKHLRLGATYTLLSSRRPEKTKDKSEYADLEYGGGEPLHYASLVGYNRFPAYWRPRHRLSLEATATQKAWGWLRVSLRARYQYTRSKGVTADKLEHREWYEPKLTVGPDGAPAASAELDETTDRWTTKEVAGCHDHVLRCRLKLAMDRKRQRLSPFVSAETHNSLGAGDHMVLEKVRTALGAGWKVTKADELTLAYVLTFDLHDDDGDLERLHDRRHAVSIGYTHEF